MILIAPSLEIPMPIKLEHEVHPQPNQWKPDEDKALATADPLEKIANEMHARGFASLWTETKPKQDRVGITFDDKTKRLYLRKLAVTGRHGYSAAHAGVSRSCVNAHKRRDPVFAAAIEEALEYFRDLLQGELIRRGIEGFEEEVVGGKNRNEIIKVRKYSDKCIELLGKIHIAQLNHQSMRGSVNASTDQAEMVEQAHLNGPFDLDDMPPEELAMFQQLLESQAKRMQIKATVEAKQPIKDINPEGDK